MTDLSTLTVEDFAATVGATYALDAGATGPLALRLETAEVAAGAAAGTARVPFSLVFVGPPVPALEQAMHVLRHDGLGELELFLVPIAADADGRRYEAVFG